VKNQAKNQMKKSKLIFFSVFIIVFFTSNSAFAFDVKNIIDSAKEILGISKSSAPSQTKPAPAGAKAPAQGKSQSAQTGVTKAPAQNQAKPTPSSTAVPVQGKSQPAPVAETKTPAANQIKPAPVGTTVQTQDKNQPVSASPWASTSSESYSYNPAGKTDPFRPFIVVEAAVKKPADKPVSTSIFPLQRAEADSYKVVGIAGSEDGRVAIVEDAGKKFYPLLKGTRIGLHNGKVIEIMADRVIVEEYDNKKAKRVYLKLRKN
jgi:type IV pilus assembly protein PilP